MSSSPWSYTRNQRSGLIILLLLLASTYYLTHHWPGPAGVDYSTADSTLFAAADRMRTSAPATGPRPAASFPFDPNTVPADDLQRLGLSERQATAWIRYRDKRPLRSAADIGRLRVLQPEQAIRLQELARFPPPDRKTKTVAAGQASPPERFFFDPNTVSADSLRRLGFNERETAALMRYRSYRPLTFQKPDDLRRVRALDTGRLNEVMDLVRIALPEDTAPADLAPNKQVAAIDTISVVDINQAGLDEWTRLPGIGPSRARRILEYRERLGGFATVDQVATTYGIPDSVYREILPLLRASPIVRPLYINRLSAEELAHHPLLKRSTATVLVRYRENHGPFRSAEDLKKVRALSTETLHALLPYLNFQL
ncbi:helix-hairpin-helix domain-containing protein [Neolewinella litorea]|uniref:Helix-hairpin-helix domain-containing protein n=1 Tax=Neolewinella litorea TaxID=2562452 RepID=A0A4S4NS73_9BACT|nr:helix-hairpin-helix domain-containing protein [Neolewinella litorea]THH41281.1 hypothetical protein E4021_01400 [Neolewinella litorea]